jgi:hypothetical protein
VKNKIENFIYNKKIKMNDFLSYLPKEENLYEELIGNISGEVILNKYKLIPSTKMKINDRMKELSQ